MEFCGECSSSSYSSSSSSSSSSKETNFKFHAFVFSGVCFALVKLLQEDQRKSVLSYPRVGTALNHHNVSLEIQRYIPYYWCTIFSQPVFVKQTLAMNHSLFTNWFPDMFFQWYITSKTNLPSSTGKNQHLIRMALISVHLRVIWTYDPCPLKKWPSTRTFWHVQVDPKELKWL